MKIKVSWICGRPGFSGDKSVSNFPALIPGLRYEGMAISNGQEASTIYSSLNLIEDRAAVERIRKELLEYCRFDTLAMVKVVERLREVAG